MDGELGDLCVVFLSCDKLVETFCEFCVFLCFCANLHGTLSRWNHLWLNEGFATLFQWYGLEAIQAYKKSLVWQYSYLRDRTWALDSDYDKPKEDSRITVKNKDLIIDFDDIEFGPISYQRGACMLTMLRLNFKIIFEKSKYLSGQFSVRKHFYRASGPI